MPSILEQTVARLLRISEQLFDVRQDMPDEAYLGLCTELHDFYKWSCERPRRRVSAEDEAMMEAMTAMLMKMESVSVGTRITPKTCEDEAMQTGAIISSIDGVLHVSMGSQDVLITLQRSQGRQKCWVMQSMEIAPAEVVCRGKAPTLLLKGRS